MFSRAQRGSSACVAGRQAKIFSRLAVWPAPVGAKGPFTTTLKIAPLRGKVA